MRVAVWYSNKDIRLEERPVPAIGPGEMLVRIEASGICGSDVMEWYRLDRAPLVLGHEIAGEVVKVGEGVTSYKVGERVAVAHHVPCLACRYCLAGHETVCETLRRTNFDPGGFAEYVRLPAINVDRGVFRLPDGMSWEEATFIEPLACVLRGQHRAGLQPGQSVLVIGSGISGLLHIMLARASGAGTIAAVDISDYRLRAAQRFGADAAFQAGEYTPQNLREMNEGRLADLVIVCTGAAAAASQALAAVERGGTVLFFAPTGPGVTVPLSVNDVFWRTDVTLTTSYAGSPADYTAALDLIKSGRLPVTDMITARLGLGETGRGFKLVAAAGESLKVIIFPQR
jgi:L-iditol 2-dehydrogenase